MALTITPLNKQHDRKAFDCGEPSLNNYLRRYANQDINRRVSRVFVASFSAALEQPVGYYSLSVASLDAAHLPKNYRRRLPGYPLPIALLGRLAITTACQGQGLGSILLADALQRVVQASLVMAVYAVVVDALDERAGTFYQQFGFIPIPSQPLKLFLPTNSIIKLVR